jgi:hypothetical protein
MRKYSLFSCKDRMSPATSYGILATNCRLLGHSGNRHPGCPPEERMLSRGPVAVVAYFPGKELSIAGNQLLDFLAVAGGGAGG